jgi:hypothetical protein
MAAAKSLPRCYPRLKNEGIVGNLHRGTSVRDRGVGGSNPLAPDQISQQNPQDLIGLATRFHPGDQRFVSLPPRFPHTQSFEIRTLRSSRQAASLIPARKSLSLTLPERERGQSAEQPGPAAAD